MAGHMDRERHEETGGRKQERVHVWNRSQCFFISIRFVEKSVWEGQCILNSKMFPTSS